MIEELVRKVRELLSRVADLETREGASGGASALDDLTDVNAAAPAADQVLTWDDVAGEWIADDPPAGGVVDADDVTYTPTTLADWDGDADPGSTMDALDQLAERVDDLEAAPPAHVHDAADLTYTPTVAADWDGAADPGDVDNALDQLAERTADLEGAAAPTTVADDAIWDTAGDLVQATGANAAAKLPIGTAFQVVQANSGASANIFGPALTDWTPVIVQGANTPTLTIVYAKYIRLGTLCIAWAYVTITSAGQAGQTIDIFGFPNSALCVAGQSVGGGHAYDSGTALYEFSLSYQATSPDHLHMISGGTSSLGSGWTLANNDYITIFMVYPI